MVDLKAFRETNNLLQKDISEFLGVSMPFISHVERGLSKLPPEHLAKLLVNPNGWDTTNLVSDQSSLNIHNDSRQITTLGQNTETGDINYYGGFSQEQVQQKINEALALAQQQTEHLNAILQMKDQEIARLHALCDRYLSIIESFSPASGRNEPGKDGEQDGANAR